MGFIAIIIDDGNIMAEVFGIAVTLFFIEWILNGPKRNLKETAKGYIDVIIFHLNSELINTKGFEEEFKAYYQSQQGGQEEGSFENMISTTTSILKKITKEKMISKIESLETNDFTKLNEMCKASEEQIKRFRDDFFISLDYQERNLLLECIRSLGQLNRNSCYVKYAQTTDLVLKSYKNYCANNIKKLLESIYVLSNSLDENNWIKKIKKRFSGKRIKSTSSADATSI